MGTQASANEDQNSRRQKDDSIVVTRTERARAAGKHEDAIDIDGVGQRVYMRKGIEPAGHELVVVARSCW
jgi:hypothetical protein